MERSATLQELDAARIAGALVPYRGRTVDTARPVRVYRNLRGIGGRWSVMQGGHVVAHADAIMLRDVVFVVSAAGVARMRRLGRKVVCAYAVGKLTGSGMGITATEGDDLPVRITWDGKAAAFVCRNLTVHPLRVKASWVVRLNARGVTGSYTDTERLAS